MIQYARYICWFVGIHSLLLAQEFPSSCDIDKLANETLVEWNIPGLALSVVHKGKEVCVSGYGVKKKGEPDPVTKETIFQVASLTKAFTSATIGSLVDEGRLEWERPIRFYLPSFRLQDEYASHHMSLRDLLSGRTGLPGTSKECWRIWAHTERNSEDLLRRLQYVTPAYSFRSHFSYNNMAYMVAAKVVEQVTGIPWTQCCADRLLVPLAMDRSSFSFEALSKDNNVASAHIGGRVVPWQRWDHLFGAAGLNSCAQDMTKWLVYCLSSPRCLKESMKAETLMESEGMLNPLSNLVWPIYAHGQQIVSYGYGWMIYRLNNRTVCFHLGFSDGMQSILAVVPEEELGICILTNQSPHLGAACLLQELLDRYLHNPAVSWHDQGHKVVQKIGQAVEVERKAILTKGFRPTRPLGDYVGRYTHPAYGTVIVSLNSESLEFCVWTGEKGPLIPFEKDEFVVVDEPADPTNPLHLSFIFPEERKKEAVLVISNLGEFRADPITASCNWKL